MRCAQVKPINFAIDTVNFAPASGNMNSTIKDLKVIKILWIPFIIFPSFLKES
jgi:hypothetical protein